MNSVVFAALLVFCALHKESTASILNQCKSQLRGSSGAPGDECGINSRCRRRLPSHFSATCVNDQCVCDNPSTLGKGNFMCFNPEQEFCSVTNDPHIRTFDGSNVNVPLSCMTMLTAVKSPICETIANYGGIVLTNNIGFREGHFHFNPRSDVGTCETTIYTWGQRKVNGGKTFPEGIQASFKITIGDVSEIITYRIYGKEHNGVYWFCAEKSSNPDGLGGPWFNVGNSHQETRFKTAHGHIVPGRDIGNNFFDIDASICGLHLGIRPVNDSKPREQVPGVFVKVHKTCNPEFPDVSGKFELCGFPTGTGNTLNDLVNDLQQQTGKTVSKEVATMYGILTSDIPQAFPGADRNLQTALDIASQCDVKKLTCAIKNCLPFLEPRFQLCFLDFDGATAAKQFSDCLSAYCTKSTYMCQVVKSRVVSSGCSKALQGVDSILDHVCSNAPFV